MREGERGKGERGKGEKGKRGKGEKEKRGKGEKGKRGKGKRGKGKEGKGERGKGEILATSGVQVVVVGLIISFEKKSIEIKHLKCLISIDGLALSYFGENHTCILRSILRIMGRKGRKGRTPHILDFKGDYRKARFSISKIRNNFF